MAGWSIRDAAEDDAEAIRSIYNAEVAGGTATLDMVERDLPAQLAVIGEHGGVYPLLVCEAGGQVLGFASLSPYRDRPGYATTVECSVYVESANRRSGTGRALLGALVEAARDRGFHAVIARITGSNEASVGLHAACGFEVVGTEHEVGRKFGRWLDVVVMERILHR